MPSATINGFEMNYEDHGSGEVLLFAHGWVASQRAWGGVTPSLSEKYRCVTFDYRGAGSSERIATGHSMEQYAADMIGLADHLGIDRFTAIGHSMGGVVATRAALDSPDRIARLVLVSSAPGSDFVAPELVQGLIGLSGMIAAGDKGATEAFLRGIWERQDEAVVLGSVDQAVASGFEFITDSIRSFADAKYGDRLVEIQVPALAVTGALDPFLPGTFAVKEKFAKGTMHVFYRVSHMPVAEVPGELASVIDDFVAHN